MNAVGHKINEGADNVPDQTTIQPLNMYHIGYALNNTVVKNVARKILISLVVV